MTPKNVLAALASVLMVCGAVAAGCDSPSGSGGSANNAAPVSNRPAGELHSQLEIPATEANVAAASDWANWRGPAGRAVAAETAVPSAWPAVPVPGWSATLGTGWSSPVVQNGRVVVTDRTGGKEAVLAFDLKTGKPLWRQENPVDFDPHAVGRRHGNGPKSTPVLFADRVYSLGIAGWLQCLDAASGKPIWQVNLPASFGKVTPLPDGRAYVNNTECVVVPIGNGQGASVPLFGYTGSPVLADGKLILSVGGERGGTIMAFDADSGQEVWRSLSENVSYSSPVVATVAGTPQVIVMTGPRVVGLDLADGKLLWSHPFQIQYDESISTPLVLGDAVLVSGDGKPLTALKIALEDSTWSCTLAWTNRDLTSYLSSMIAVGAHVYGMDDFGQFTCVHAADGKTVWADGNHGYYCSPILVGKQLWCLNDAGSLAVVAADPTAFSELGKSQLAKAACWTMPAVADGRLLIRADGELRCFDLAELK